MTVTPPAASHAARLPRSRSRTASPRWPRRLLIAAILAAAVVVAYLFWLRDSSLVEVREVRVEGVSGENAEEIRATLAAAAGKMTTLHVDTGALEDAVRRFPTVGSVSAEPEFPHGLTIRISERPPVALAKFGGVTVAVAADGTVLTGASSEGLELPTIRLAAEPPPSGRLADQELAQALVLGAAPAPLRPLIESSSASETEGVALTLRGGIELRFGDPTGAERKWAAAAAILADPKLDGLGYVDVRVPRRPAVGGAPPTAQPTAVPGAVPPATDPAGAGVLPAAGEG